MGKKNTEKHVSKNEKCMDLFSFLDELITSLDGEIDRIREIDLLVMIDDDEKECRKSAKKCVPTNDRIAIPKKVVKECQKMCKAKTAATENGGFTNKEIAEIKRMWKLGYAIKMIAKTIHRRDKTVSAWIKANGLKRAK